MTGCYVTIIKYSVHVLSFFASFYCSRPLSSKSISMFSIPLNAKNGKKWLRKGDGWLREGSVAQLEGLVAKQRGCVNKQVDGWLNGKW